MRVGMGYDVHRLVEDRDLILCGIHVPFEKGLKGHSDADVAVHAIMDALLGAAGLGDIGRHFPDTDDSYKGISSLVLLERVGEMLEEQNFLIENLDVTIVAERPKLAQYMEMMGYRISRTLKMESGKVNIKATTEEGLGFTGTGEGIRAYAICSLMSLLDLAAGDRIENPGCQGCCGKQRGECPGHRDFGGADEQTSKKKEPEL